MTMRARTRLLAVARAVALAAALAPAVSARADTLTVAPNGSADFATIAAALAVAADGDIVLVRPGTYTEDVDLGGLDVTLRGEGGPAVTFLVGTGDVPVVDVGFGFDARPVLEGFDISGGSSQGADPFGGCVRATDSELVLRDLVVHDCTALDGGGIGLRRWGGTIEGVRVHGTYAFVSGDGGNGGAIWLQDSDGTLDRIVIHDVLADTEGGGLHVDGGAPVITRLRVARAEALVGGGIMLRGTAATLGRVVLTENQSTVGGAAFASSAFATTQIARIQAYENRNELSSSLLYTNGGGAGWVDGASLTVDGGAFALNRADGFGGAIGSVDAQDLDLDRLLVLGNTAENGAGLALLRSLGLHLRRSRVGANFPDDLIGGAQLSTDDGLVEGVVFDAGTSSWNSGCVRLDCGGCLPDSGPGLLLRNSIFDACSADEGATMTVREGIVTLQQVTIVRATPEGFASAVVVEGFDAPSSTVVEGLIVADPVRGTPFEFRPGAGSYAVRVSHTLYELGAGASFSGPVPGVTLGEGVVEGSPQFEGTDIADWSTYLRLAAGSPGQDDGPLGLLDPDNTAADLGAFGGPGATIWDEGDADGDGVTVWERDCDDHDPAVLPGATELCNCVDDNCDFAVDEGCAADPCDPADWDADAPGDDDDSSGDDDDSSGDDDDSSGDDDDATGGGDDDDEDPGPPPAVGCLLRCDATHGGATLAPALALLLLLRGRGGRLDQASRRAAGRSPP